MTVRSSLLLDKKSGNSPQLPHSDCVQPRQGDIISAREITPPRYKAERGCQVWREPCAEWCRGSLPLAVGPVRTRRACLGMGTPFFFQVSSFKFPVSGLGSIPEFQLQPCLALRVLCGSSLRSLRFKILPKAAAPTAQWSHRQSDPLRCPPDPSSCRPPWRESPTQCRHC